MKEKGLFRRVTKRCPMKKHYEENFTPWNSTLWRWEMPTCHCFFDYFTCCKGDVQSTLAVKVDTRDASVKLVHQHAGKNIHVATSLQDLEAAQKFTIVAE